jgi:hypothetical protein
MTVIPTPDWNLTPVSETELLRLKNDVTPDELAQDPTNPPVDAL